MSKTQDVSLDEDETARRRDGALRRALNTPPKPKATPNPRKEKPAGRTSAEKRERPA